MLRDGGVWLVRLGGERGGVSGSVGRGGAGYWKQTREGLLTSAKMVWRRLKMRSGSLAERCDGIVTGKGSGDEGMAGEERFWFGLMIRGSF